MAIVHNNSFFKALLGDSIELKGLELNICVLISLNIVQQRICKMKNVLI